ncbi:ammonium transporter [Desulfurobacterium atlanticum]|uniref:Ammonium transporter n=1 Tax=Desulfurobacterium atlanticum TaxID=240169 RepID=A0A238YEC2_9BACT|nr:ammonium transporter [Desulfurobacterium atlanticum]SNR69497.1 ammonium transporter [Desulfurobacterium atlanticum]
MRTGKAALQSLMLALAMFSPAFAAGKIDSGDTAWLLISTALVVMMTPAGLAMFYAGMSRAKNILNTIGMSYVSYAVASVVWVVIGYSLAFGNDIGGFIGGLNHLFLSGIGVNDVSGTIPALLFVSFQMAFAGIAIAIVSGSVIERMKFSAWIIFSALWIVFVYAPIAHWVWGDGGWLLKMDALDFAGGAVIHINAGITGLVLAYLVGKRKGYGKKPFFPSSIALTALGVGLLWFGWFGFNGGSALAANQSAALALITTNTAAAMGALTWMIVEWVRDGHPTVLGIVSGVVAGLVGITPAAGFVNVLGALIIGITSAIVGYFGVAVLKPKLGYDDSLDAFGVHGLCGIWGALATGLFADPSVSGKAGLFFGNVEQFIVQLISVVAVIAYSGIVSFIVAMVVKGIVGLRVDEEEEFDGLDKAVHGERGFELE